MAIETAHFVCAATLAEVESAGCLPVRVEGNTLVLFAHGGRIYAVDNRCPHMGFPLDRGTVHDGILTCHWHHARFDLASGGTFDQFAGDVRVFPVEVRDSAVWVDVATYADPRAYHRERLHDGLERNIPLVLAKAVIALLESPGDPAAPFRIGLEFGVRYRQGGWGQGLTMHTCVMNLLPFLDPEERSRALYHGLSAVARDSAGMAPRFALRPLSESAADGETLKRWFRRFVEVRDAEGAERCIVSAVRAGAGPGQMADMLFSAVTDHRYIQIGHVADFTNKALEALDTAGWDLAEPVLASLATAYANADRMEESNEWRNPVDLVAILEQAFEALPAALETGVAARGAWDARKELVAILVGEDPQASVDALLSAVRDGATPQALAGAVAYAAALRIARFHTSNEFTDWDTALHTFTFASAIHQATLRAPTVDVLRGVFDAAMSVYLDRFLNVPPARIPDAGRRHSQPEALLRALPSLLDRQQQVNEAGALVAHYLSSGGEPRRLIAALGSALLREDRDFHTIQTIEAAVRQHQLLGGAPEGAHVLIAAARYLAAHAPTVRAQGQTYQIALRLSRGERLFEEAD